MLMEIKANRNKGIELCRLMLMYMVCILHTLGGGGVLDNCVEGNIRYYVFWFIEISSYCAVDGFAFISGYTFSGKAVSIKKAVSLEVQALFYSAFLTGLLFLIGIRVSLSPLEIIELFFPITANTFWYLSAYFGILVFLPFIDMTINKLDERKAKELLTLFIIIFSMWGLLNNSFSLEWGYSTIWILIVYIIGALSKKINLFSRINTSILLSVFLANTVVMWIIRTIFHIGRIVNYNSPLVLINGIVIVILFSRINIRSNKLLYISPLALGAYLFHSNVVVNRIVLENHLLWVIKKPIYIGVIIILVFAFFLFACGLICELIRLKLNKLVHIDSIIQKIGAFINYIISFIVDRIR